MVGLTAYAKVGITPHRFLVHANESRRRFDSAQSIQPRCFICFSFSSLQRARLNLISDEFFLVRNIAARGKRPFQPPRREPEIAFGLATASDLNHTPPLGGGGNHSF